MLEIQDLVKVYPGPVAALQGIRLSLPKGMFGLLGPNGSGKSTLMRILAGLLEPTSGRVLWDGVDVTERPELVWPRLGNLPQDFGFYPNLTGEAMLTHLLKLKGVEAPSGLKALGKELLRRVNLTHAAKRKVKSYSGGMRQRLGIAQAIAGNPDLIIVDEPTAGLDPEERNRFYRLLSELAEERIVLLSTHIVDDVAVLCPRFAVIRNGRLLATTTPDAARAAIDGHLYDGTVSSAEMARLSQSAQSTTADRFVPGFQITQTHLVEGQNRVRIYSPEKDVPEGFESVPPTLEDAYFILIQADVASDTTKTDSFANSTRPTEQTETLASGGR